MTTTGDRITELEEMTSPNNSDVLPITDVSYPTGAKTQKITFTTIKTFLKAYFDTLYTTYVHPNHTGEVTSVGDGATTIANKVTMTGTSPVSISGSPTVIATSAVAVSMPAATNASAGHATAAQITALEAASAASHSRQHAITGTSDHTSAATAGYLLKADANGLPVQATNTDAEVAALVAGGGSGVSALLITEDLSEQITGSTAHFTTAAPMLTWPMVYCNLRQLPGSIIVDADGLGFTLGYTPTVNDSLIVDYYCSASSIIVDNDGGYVYDDQGNIALEV